MGTLTANHSNRSRHAWFLSDSQFDHLYPSEIQLLARKHWTPLNITNISVQFLVPHPGVKILDIGSGVGKFCIAGGYFKPSAEFFGVEQRKHLVAHAEVAKSILQLENAQFFSQNLTQINFNRFDHFYFFNSFYENLPETDKIDDSIICSPHLYHYYNHYLFKALSKVRVGTRLVTFHSLDDKIPSNYELVDMQYGNLLKFWLKVE